MNTPQKHIKISSTEDKIEALLRKAFTESFPFGLWILTLLISPVLLLVIEGNMFSGGNAVQNVLTVYFFTFMLSLITSIPTMIVFYFVFKFLVKRINVWWMAFTAIAFPMFGVITTLYLLDIFLLEFTTLYLFGILLSFMIMVLRKRKKAQQ